MNYLLVLTLSLALVSCSCAAAAFANFAKFSAKPNGQPGCQTEEEIAVVYYPHFLIKNQYWTCHSQGVPATLSYCPIATAFLDDAKACVPWPQWYFTPTELPPSQPIAANGI